MRYDAQAVSQAVRLLHGDSLFEIRCIIGKKIFSGYFTKTDRLFYELDKLPENGNVYITLQNVQSDCYNREQRDRLVLAPKATTKDSEITDYCTMLIDLDPVRLSNIGSTAPQLGAAHSKALSIYAYLGKLGFKKPLVAMSGNGWHLLYRVSLKNTPENVQLVKDCLSALDRQFSDDAVKVDTTVFNPARICKLYGTFAKKGADTPETPYRQARIANADKVPGWADEITPRDILQTLADTAPKQQAQPSVVSDSPPQAFDLDEWLKRFSVPVKEVVNVNGGTRYILEHCPFDPNHKGKDAAVFRQADGTLGFKCFHDSCSGKGWKNFRLHFEPNAYDRPEPDTSLKPNHMSAQPPPQGIWGKACNLSVSAHSDEPKFYTLSDILALPKTNEEYIPTGINGLDKLLGGLKKTLVTCVSGLRGSGKSSVLSQILLHASLFAGARCLMFSGELTERTAADWLFRQAVGTADNLLKMSKFEAKYYVSDENKKIIADTLSDKLFIYNNNYGNNYNSVLSEMGKIHDEKQVDLILLDNLMSLDIREAARNDKYEAQSRFVEQLEMFAKLTNTHIIFVAHPRKAQGFLRLDDISGSGDIANRVDNALIVHRCNNDFKRLSGQCFGWKQDHSNYQCDNLIEICKDRENGTQDEFVRLFFDRATKRFGNFAGEKTDYFNGRLSKPF